MQNKTSDQEARIAELIGVGLRHPHYSEVIENFPKVGWFEVHSENFFQKGGPALDMLMGLRKNYPISLHGVGLSLGSANGVLKEHLTRLRELINLIDPFLVSEHLSWGYIDGVYLPDLLPVPYTKESLANFIQNVNLTQDFFKREILIENPSSYLEYQATKIDEVDFLTELCKITGAKILLDVNNVFVSCYNHGWSAQQYIDQIPVNLVKEIHLAGHSTKQIAPNKIIRIDTHDNHVLEEVWELYDYAIRKFGLIPTLLEWDAKIPTFSEMLREANKAGKSLRKHYAQS